MVADHWSGRRLYRRGAVRPLRHSNGDRCPVDRRAVPIMARHRCNPRGRVLGLIARFRDRDDNRRDRDDRRWRGDTESVSARAARHGFPSGTRRIEYGWSRQPVIRNTRHLAEHDVFDKHLSCGSDRSGCQTGRRCDRRRVSCAGVLSKSRCCDHRDSGSCRGGVHYGAHCLALFAGNEDRYSRRVGLPQGSDRRSRVLGGSRLSKPVDIPRVAWRRILRGVARQRHDFRFIGGHYRHAIYGGHSAQTEASEGGAGTRLATATHRFLAWFRFIR